MSTEVSRNLSLFCVSISLASLLLRRRLPLAQLTLMMPAAKISANINNIEWSLFSFYFLVVAAQFSIIKPLYNHSTSVHVCVHASGCSARQAAGLRLREHIRTCFTNLFYNNLCVQKFVVNTDCHLIRSSLHSRTHLQHWKSFAIREWDCTWEENAREPRKWCNKWADNSSSVDKMCFFLLCFFSQAQLRVSVWWSLVVGRSLFLFNYFLVRACGVSVQQYSMGRRTKWIDHTNKATNSLYWHVRMLPFAAIAIQLLSVRQIRNHLAMNVSPQNLYRFFFSKFAQAECATYDYGLVVFDLRNHYWICVASDFHIECH